VMPPNTRLKLSAAVPKRFLCASASDVVEFCS
jgi:hypothetical protein